MLLKTCSKCGEGKPTEGFKKDSSSKTGRKSYCKACAAAHAKAWYKNNTERGKESRRMYRAENAEHLREVNRQHYRNNKDAYLARAKAAYEARPEYVKARNKAWEERNSEHVKARKNAYRAANAERLNERSRERYKLDPTPFARSRKAWQQKNPSRVRAYGADYRARRIKAAPSWANAEYIRLWYEVARLEEARTGRKCHVDHIVPLNSSVVCGLHNEHNLRVMFAEDNIRKGNRHAA